MDRENQILSFVSGFLMFQQIHQFYHSLVIFEFVLLFIKIKQRVLSVQSGVNTNNLLRGVSKHRRFIT